MATSNAGPYQPFPIGPGDSHAEGFSHLYATRTSADVAVSALGIYYSMSIVFATATDERRGKWLQNKVA